MITIGPANDERKQEFEHNGIKYILKAYDPYGFIKITCLKINKTLDGYYTSFTEAKKAAIQHASKFEDDKLKKKVKNA